MPRLEAASISITSRRIAAGDFQAAGAHAAGRGGGTLDAVQAARQDARDRGFARAALAGKDVAVRDALLRDGVLERGADVLLADQFRKRLRPVFPGDDLVHGGMELAEYARPRVIRGTRVKPLPLLPSGPGGVHSRPLHEARSLTTSHASMRTNWRRLETTQCAEAPHRSEGTNDGLRQARAQNRDARRISGPPRLLRPPAWRTCRVLPERSASARRLRARLLALAPDDHGPRQTSQQRCWHPRNSTAIARQFQTPYRAIILRRRPKALFSAGAIGGASNNQCGECLLRSPR